MARDLAWFQDLYARGTRAETVADCWTEDVVVVQSSDVPGTAGTFRGHEGVIAAGRELGESVRRMSWLLSEVQELGGDRYLVLLHMRGEGHGSGVPVDVEAGHVVTLDGDRIARLEAFLGWDTARAAAAAGAG
ncbi:MAG: nuclear transport factor 2 family protein [Thermoleophilaceae bacterium]